MMDGIEQVVELDPATTAVVAVDLQHELVAPDGALAGFLDAAAVAPALERAGAVLDAARAAGCLVVHARLAFRPGYPDLVVTNDVFAAIHERGALVEGDAGAELVDAYRAPGDVVVTHRRLSAFHGTELDVVLQKRGIQTAAFVGLTLETTVHSTARHAVNLGRHVAVLGDCCAGRSAASHAEALDALRFLVTVASSEDLL